MPSLQASVNFRNSWLSSFSKRDDLSIQIAIDHDYQSKVYTSGSPVSGCVSILSQRNLAFENVEVTFTGTAISEVDLLYLDKPPPTYTFLRLDMPLPPNTLPDSRVFEAGESYNVPFTFTIPHQLPTAACRYSRCTVVHEEHLRLPSSIGSWHHDDTPQTVRIDYAVTAKVIAKSPQDGKMKPVESTHRISVLSGVPEIPRLPIAPDNVLYRFTQGNMVQRGRFSPKTGYLRASATQADPMILSLDTLQVSDSSVTVDLEFHATSTENTPPDVYAKSAYLLAITHYSLSHIGYLPDREPHPLTTRCPVTPYRRSTDLAIEQTKGIRWELIPSSCPKGSTEKLFAEDELGHEALGEKHATEASQSSIKSDRVDKAYRATLDFCLRLPSARKKLLVPTFHSCRISRVYSIHFVLAADAFKTVLALALPLQVVVQDTYSPQAIGPPGYVHLDMEDDLDSNPPPPYDDILS